MVKHTATTRRAALVFIASGMTISAAETFGFANISAKRGVNVNTAPDSDALLSIDGAADTDVTPKFTNRSGSIMDVSLSSSEDIEFDVGDNGNWGAPPATFSLTSSESTEVNIRFVGECTGAGPATIDVTAELKSEYDDLLGTITLSRDFQIPQSGQVQFSGNAKGTGGSGKYEFELENTGCQDVTFTGIGINETTTDAEYVSGDGSLTNLNTGEEVVTREIPIDSSDPSSDTRCNMDPTVTLPVDGTVSFEFDRFQRNGNPSNVKMDGQDVRITLYYGDGSSSTVTLCLEGCDF